MSGASAMKKSYSSAIWRAFRLFPARSSIWSGVTMRAAASFALKASWPLAKMHTLIGFPRPFGRTTSSSRRFFATERSTSFRLMATSTDSGNFRSGAESTAFLIASIVFASALGGPPPADLHPPLLRVLPLEGVPLEGRDLQDLLQGDAADHQLPRLAAALFRADLLQDERGHRRRPNLARVRLRLGVDEEDDGDLHPVEGFLPLVHVLHDLHDVQAEGSERGTEGRAGGGLSTIHEDLETLGHVPRPTGDCDIKVWRWGGASGVWSGPSGAFLAGIAIQGRRSRCRGRPTAARSSGRSRRTTTRGATATGDARATSTRGPRRGTATAAACGGGRGGALGPTAGA